MLLTTGGAAAVDELHRLFQQPLGQLLWIGNGGAGADKLGPAAVKSADALEATQHIGHVAAKDAAIGVQLVDDHVAQPAKKLGPAGVIRQDAAVQHVRIGEDQAGIFAQGGAMGGGRVAIVGGNLRLVNWWIGRWGSDLGSQRMELSKLILGQGFGGKKIQGAGRWFAE